MGRPAIDLAGKTFGQLTVLERASEGQGSDPHVCWRCRCSCGNTIVTSGQRLRNGTVQSCGCFRKVRMSKLSIDSNTTHGKAKTKLYKVFYGMIDRCYNPNNTRYKNYGGRGIRICPEWLDNFPAFYAWAMAHGYHEGLSIDRIDNDQGYSPQNCRWTNVEQQNRNTRSNHLITYQGKTQTVVEWAEELGIPKTTLFTRLSRGWSVEATLNTPPKKSKS